MVKSLVLLICLFLCLFENAVCSQVRGLTRVAVTSEEEALAQFFVGEQGRATAGHVLNASSSRSHALFTIHLEVCTAVAVCVCNA